MKGKEKCEFLKGIRKRMAEANGIPYESRDCTYEGECTGTCPFCEKEATELMAKLKEKEAEGVVIKPDEVGMLATELMKYWQDTNSGEQESIVRTGAEGILSDKNAETSTSLIDPFRGANNPIMSEKELCEMRDMKRVIQESEKPLMGDIRVPYRELNEEDKEAMRLLQEETLRKEIEQERKEKSIITKIKNRIRDTFEPPLRGEIE